MSVVFFASGVVLAEEAPHIGAVPQTVQPVLISEDETIAQSSTAGDECLTRSVVTYREPSQTRAAAFYFPWFAASGNCAEDATSDWCAKYLGPKPGAPKPLAGFYTSSDHAAVTTHLTQMRGRVDVVAIEWNGNEDQKWIIEHVILPKLAAHELQFVILYDLAIRFRDMDPVDDGDGLRLSIDGTSTQVPTRLRDDIAELRNDYFGHPQYLRLGGKPVLYMYVSRQIARDPRAPGFVRSTFDAIHASVKADARFPNGMFLVADQIYWGTPPPGEAWKGPDYSMLVDIGASAATAFGPVTKVEKEVAAYGGLVPQNAANPMKLWADKMSVLYSEAKNRLPREKAVDLMPGILPQFDNTGYGDYVWHLRNVSDWTYMIETAGGRQHRWVAVTNTTQPNCSTVTSVNGDGTSIVWVYSFNEWGEGTGIEPLEARNPEYPYGFGDALLAALKPTLSSTNADNSAPPVPVSPSGIVEGARPSFAWDTILDGIEYQLRVFDSGGTPVVDVVTASTKYVPSLPLAVNQAHTWRVRGRTASGWTAYSEALSFTPTELSTSPPGPPVLITPSGCINSRRPTFSWQATARAADYKIKITRVIPEDLELYVEVAGTSYTPPNDLTPGEQYRWTVKARNGAGDSLFADPEMYFTPGCVAPVARLGPGATVGEGTAAPNTASLVVSLDRPSTSSVTVNYSTVAGTAVPELDYVAATGARDDVRIETLGVE